MGVLIIGGTVALVVALVQRAGGSATTAAGNWQMTLDQPAGARIGGVAATGGGIGVWVQRADGDRVLVVDPQGGRVLGEIRLSR